MTTALAVLLLLVAPAKGHPKEAPPKAGAPVVPKEGVSIVRTHKVGQRYQVFMSSEDSSLKATRVIKGTAKVTAASKEVSEFELDVGVSQDLKKPKASGIKVKVSVREHSADAEVLSAGVEPDAEMMLTSFEMLMGDLCQPPVGPYLEGKPVVDKGGNTWRLTSLKGDVAAISSSPKAGEPFTCDVEVSLTDGFAGKREVSSHLDLHARNPSTGAAMMVEQHYSVKVERK